MMKAVYIVEPHVIEYRDIPEPPAPLDDEVTIELKAAGICGTDVHIYHGVHAAAKYPRIPGHELVGIITAVGSEVKELQIGDRVAIDPVVSCGQCFLCQEGRHNICHQVMCLGVQTDGGFTEKINVKAERVYKFNPQIPWEEAALVEPYSIGAQMVDRGRITANDRVLIIGGGPIGLTVLQIAQNVQGAQVIVADILPNRLELAKEMGALAVINPQGKSAIQESYDYWSQGPNVIVDAVGSAKILEQTVQEAPHGTRIIEIGFNSEESRIRPVDITKKELEIIGSRMNKHKFPEVLQWFKEGKIQPRLLISHRFSYTELDKAMGIIEKEPTKVCKVILDF
ncbi:MAG: zinc-binding alcohol dehydrogenase family protein [Bacillota bacterium]|uniref:Alcohol dehydrogenase catalytic domain-containing protein n=1 Tax=Thermanaerosceptrum fracticalcis TaxID=1712410 RepID=A0A7G6DZB7_THEFR|nr:zinc-binding alcohol dehydrogenase family protein [Thermanaerosceptrum fracticalcis]QNB45171.1 alcohol dehydrogenase catalytic domain-containing protein [Thermanaerosceptrum fracticalcis]